MQDNSFSEYYPHSNHYAKDYKYINNNIDRSPNQTENSIESEEINKKYEMSAREPFSNNYNIYRNNSLAKNRLCSKTNSFYNMRRNASNKDFVHSNLRYLNNQPDIPKNKKRYYSNSLDYRRRIHNNKDYLKHKMDIDRTNNLLEKIRNVSNKLEKTMNLYRDKNFFSKKLNNKRKNDDYTQRVGNNIDSYFDKINCYNEHKLKPNESFTHVNDIGSQCLKKKNDKEKINSKKDKNISGIISRKKLNKYLKRDSSNYNKQVKQKKYLIDNNMKLNELEDIDRKKYKKYQVQGKNIIDIYKKNNNSKRYESVNRDNDENQDTSNNNYTDRYYGTHFRYYLDKNKMKEEMKKIENSNGYNTVRDNEDNLFKTTSFKDINHKYSHHYCKQKDNRSIEDINKNNICTDIDNKFNTNDSKLDESLLNSYNKCQKMAEIMDKKDEQIKSLQLELEKSNQANSAYQLKYEQIFEDNNKLISENKVILNEKTSCLYDIEELKKVNDKNIQRIKELEIDNKELLHQINTYKDYQKNYATLKEEHDKLLHDNSQLREHFIKLENDYKKLESKKVENKTNFDELLCKHNILLDKSKELNRENNKLKNELIEMKKANDVLQLEIKKMQNEKNNLCDDYTDKINKINYLSDDYNNIKYQYEDNIKKYKNLENENIELSKINDININKIKELEEKVKEYENYIENQNNDNEKKFDETNELKSQIILLNNTIDKNKREIEELKNRLYNKNNNSFEDEIIIVNKETTYTNDKGEKTKNGTVKNSYSVIKKVDMDENQIIKYHEIIQDLSNMILIYENFFFRDKIKPKNNQELFCYLLMNLINNKIRKIKLNVLMNLIIHQKLNHKKITNKYNNYIYDSSLYNKGYKKNDFSNRNKNYNSYEEEEIEERE